MIALLDADLVAFRCAASAENDSVDEALYRADALMQEIIGSVGADSYTGYLTGRNNFRKTLTPDYKANRKDKPLPQHLQTVREFLVNHWKCEVTDGYEADDALGVQATSNPDSVICSLDKDLLQIPGKHYNWVKKLWLDVGHDEGLLSFYTSTLVGDRSDNIIGVHGIGPVKAERVLSSLLPEEYYQACRELYNDDERYHLNCKLLWIWRELNGTWQPPGETDVADAGSEREQVPSNSSDLGTSVEPT